MLMIWRVCYFHHDQESIPTDMPLVLCVSVECSHIWQPKSIFTIDWANTTNILLLLEYNSYIRRNSLQYNLHTYIRTWYKSKILHKQDLSTRKKNVSNVRRNQYEMYVENNKNGKNMGLHTIKKINEISQNILCSFTNKTTNNQSKSSPHDIL